MVTIFTLNITINLYKINTFGLPKQEEKHVQSHQLNDKVVKKMVDDVALLKRLMQWLFSG